MVLRCQQIANCQMKTQEGGLSPFLPPPSSTPDSVLSFSLHLPLSPDIGRAEEAVVAKKLLAFLGTLLPRSLFFE